ncbi:hypothetical protein EG327_010834 [Venturia inaequalis]|uniref:Uncharacterized protein n=1 Tax=Venturia inaequalis TaxID=5025 RepID=A0A8H3VS52_VENIN|nr:hypothetical protein EG327_010834 [Venturia inaequalis]
MTAKRLRTRTSILSLPLELKQQICEEVLLDIIHNEISNAETSTSLEEHCSTFRSQAQALTLIPGFTFANEWARRKHRPRQTLYATLNDQDTLPELIFRYTYTNGLMFDRHLSSCILPPDDQIRFIVDQRSDEFWTVMADYIFQCNPWIVRHAKRFHIVIIQRQPQCYNIGPKFKLLVEFCLEYLLRPSSINACWTEAQFELRCHGQSASFQYERRKTSTSPSSTYSYVLVKAHDSFDRNEHLNPSGRRRRRGLLYYMNMYEYTIRIVGMAILVLSVMAPTLTYALRIVGMAILVWSVMASTLTYVLDL